MAQAEMQLAACTAFLQILQKQLVPLHNYTQTFLQTILVAIDSRDPGTCLCHVAFCATFPYLFRANDFGLNEYFSYVIVIPIFS